MQDTILIIPPYPYCIEEVFEDVPLDGCWFALPATCAQRVGGPQRIQPTAAALMTCVTTTFEELKLPISWPMESAGVTKLYEPFPTPWLYVAPAANMVGRIPLIPLFLAGNSTHTIPHKYSQHKRSGFPVGSCDTAAADGSSGSNVYEVNPWLWHFGRGKPRRGGLSVEEGLSGRRQGLSGRRQL